MRANGTLLSSQSPEYEPASGASSARVGSARNRLESIPRIGRATTYRIASVVVGLVLWQVASRVSASGLLPGPITVIQSAAESVASGQWLGNAIPSLGRVSTGFVLGVLVAIPIGFLMGWYHWARGICGPWIQFFRMIPALALIPLVIVILGIGEEAKIFVIFFASFLAMVVAAYEGVRNVDRTIINAARVLGAGDRTIFLRVVVPASSPYLMVGMRIALGNAWATLIAAELIAAQSGLGEMMQTASLYFDVPTIMVGIVSIGLLGLAMDRGIQLLDHRLTGWQERR